jgi:hypothetical protein
MGVNSDVTLYRKSSTVLRTNNHFGSMLVGRKTHGQNSGLFWSEVQGNITAGPKQVNLLAVIKTLQDQVKNLQDRLASAEGIRFVHCWRPNRQSPLGAAAATMLTSRVGFLERFHQASSFVGVSSAPILTYQAGTLYLTAFTMSLQVSAGQSEHAALLKVHLCGLCIIGDRIRFTFSGTVVCANGPIFFNYHDHPAGTIVHASKNTAVVGDNNWHDFDVLELISSPVAQNMVFTPRYNFQAGLTTTSCTLTSALAVAEIVGSSTL